MNKEHIRVIIPDSHGEHIDWVAADAMLRDMRMLAPARVICLGDHLDCGGTFSSHQRNYTNELVESYEADCLAANRFFDRGQKAAPRAVWDYIEGNHEAHVQRWAARMFFSKRDADMIVDCMGPETALRLKSRGIRYYRSHEMHMGLTVRGTIRVGRCFYTHGISHSKNADRVHLAKFGEPVVFGHVHRSMSVIESTATKAAIGAWCPGTLAKLQPLYKHTEPSGWTHGYAVQFVSRSGKFMHVQVPILNGASMLLPLTRRIA